MNRNTSGDLSALQGARIVVLTVVALLFALPRYPGVSAEEVPSDEQAEKTEVRLTLEECLRHALKANLSLSAQAISIGIAQQGVTSAEAAFDSQLGLDLLGREPPLGEISNTGEDLGGRWFDLSTHL